MWDRTAVVMFFPVVLLVSCRSPSSPEVLLIKITGVITSATTGAPIENASAGVYEPGYPFLGPVLAEARADQDGRYHLEYEREANVFQHVLIASADGYNWSDWYHISLTTAVQIANFQLEPL